MNLFDNIVMWTFVAILAGYTVIMLGVHCERTIGTRDTYYPLCR